MYVSQTPKFRSPSQPLQAALSALDGYDAHEAAQERAATALSSAIAARAAAESAKSGLTQLVLDALLSGDAKPGDLLKTVDHLATNADLARAERVVSILASAQDALLQERDALLLSSSDDLFRHLDGSLQAAVKQARSVDLAGVADAESAIEAGKHEAWSVFVDARSTTFRIRAAQGDVLAGLVRDSTVSQHQQTFGMFRNYGNLHPSWLAAQIATAGGVRHGAGRYEGDGVFIPRAAPWPTDASEQFLWAIQNHNVQQWVPTAQEIREAYATAHEVASYEALDPEQQQRVSAKEARNDALLAAHVRAAAGRAESAYQDGAARY
jgi:hypothetical protein